MSLKPNHSLSPLDILYNTCSLFEASWKLGWDFRSNKKKSCKRTMGFQITENGLFTMLWDHPLYLHLWAPATNTERIVDCSRNSNERQP